METVCSQCHEVFITNRSKRRFCSNKCSQKFKHPHRFKICPNCNKEFRLVKWKVENTFCSFKCYHDSGRMTKTKLRENNPNFTDGHCSYRAHARRELHQICSKCGSEENIEIHHIDYDRTNGDLSNLLVLCRKCHRKFHKKPRDRIARTCLFCKKEFYVIPSKIKDGRGKFCSRICSHKMCHSKSYIPCG